MAFANNSEYLQLKIDDYYEGANEVNLRESWIPHTQFTYLDTFTNLSAATVYGAWNMDGGDIVVTDALRESRHFCTQGKASLVFTGPYIALRIETNWGWGSATIRIDGVAPSTIANVITPTDVVDCEATVHNSPGSEYLDIVLADGLSDSQHTLEIYCENIETAWVVINGAKVRRFQVTDYTRASWVAPYGYGLNTKTLHLDNQSPSLVKNVSLVCADEIVDPSTGSPLGTIAVGDIAAGTIHNVPMALDPALSTVRGVHSYDLELTAEYPDPVGGIVYSVPVDYNPDSVSVTFSGTWDKDTNNGEYRAFTDTRGASLTFTLPVDAFTLRVQREYGWGTFRVSRDPVIKTGCAITNASPDVTVPDTAGLVVGQVVVINTNNAGIPSNTTIANIPDGTTITLSANATATATRTLAFLNNITTVSCNDANGGGFYIDVAVTGTGAGSKTIRLDRVETTAGKYVVWSAIKFTSVLHYTQVTETVSLIYNLSYIPPFAPDNVRLEGGQIVWDDPNLSRIDTAIPRDNAGVVKHNVYFRFPTFCVFYQQGRQDLLAEYDILIIEPRSVSRKDVEEWQAKGIIVLGYVTMGEEDGMQTDPYSQDSTTVGPWIGDGLGPGGFASYYNKGGNNFGEVSECSHDRRRYEGVHACALSRAEYLTNVNARCGVACWNDSRGGYAVWRTGGTCGAGFTSSNNWQRGELTACANASCPQYDPLNSHCPVYEQAAGCWGSDFTMFDHNFPDQNSIWGSSYVNPLQSSWREHLDSYYLPTLFGTGQQYTETVTLAAYSGNGVAELVFRVAHWPIDDAETITLTNTAGTFEYIRGADFAFNKDLGTFNVADLAGEDRGGPVLVAGNQLTVTYTMKGLQCDGIFMDTVDTVDVYPSPEFQQAMADLINSLKTAWPTKLFCSNRGFTILDRYIQALDFVMFESFLVDIDWDTMTYQRITDPSTIAWNLGIIEQLKDLRRNHVFDVLALNYCDNGAAGDELRQYIFDTCYALGFLSWSTTIYLNDPLPLLAQTTTANGPFKSNVWRLAHVKP